MDAIGTGIATYVAPKTIEVPVMPRVAPASQTFGSGQQSSSGSSSGERREASPDPTTGALVFRVIEVATGAVTMQTPTDARLKLRAYIDSVFTPDEAGSSVARSA
jgi:hypothetical protein